MAKEIERKFLLNDISFLKDLNYIIVKQAYIVADDSFSVRVRIIGTKAYLTLKYGQSLERDEFEYEIPLKDGEEIFQKHEAYSLSKKRYNFIFHGKKWEIDEFLDKNQGLVIAEVELESKDEIVILPDFVGKEVSNDRRYLNSYLVKKPYSSF